MSWLDRFRRGGDQGPTQPTPETKEKGRTGTINTGGFIVDEETNWELRWPNNLDVYERMRRSDPTIKWMLALMKVPCITADFYVEPASDDEKDLEAAAGVEHMLWEELDIPFVEMIRKILTMLEFGHSVFEPVAELRNIEFEYKPSKEEGSDEEPETVLVEREAFVLKKLAERRQRTIHVWNPKLGDPSCLDSIEQWLGDGYDPPNVTIPAKHLVVFTLDQEGDDWRGVSLLRSAWRDWEYKVKLENLEAIAYEHSLGIPLVWPPRNVNPETLDAMEAGLEEMRSGESLYLIFPGPRAGTGVPPEEGWEIDTFGVKGDGDADPDKAIQRHETGMARNIMAEFMRLGHEQTGARATADVQQDPYYLAVSALLEYVVGIINRQIVSRLVAWNFDVRKPPQLKFGKIQAKALEKLADALGTLVEKGVIKVDPELEKHMRDVFELPPPAPVEDEEETVEEMQQRLRDAQLAMGIQPGLETQPQPDPKAPAAPEKVPESKDPKTQSEFVPGRELRAEEKHVAFSEISTLLDNGQDDFVEQCQHAAKDSIDDAANAIATAVAAKSPEAIASIAVEPWEIEDTVFEILAGLYEKGRENIRAELRSQRGTVKLAEGLLKQIGKEAARRVLRAAAQSAAETIASAATRSLRQRALRMLQDGSVPTGAGYDPLAALRAEALGAARGLVSAAFNLGRNDEQLKNAGEISHSVYTALLDSNTCQPCRTADGTSGPPGGLPELPTPNPNCLGGGGCRCMWVPVVSAGA